MQYNIFNHKTIFSNRRDQSNCLFSRRAKLVQNGKSIWNNNNSDNNNNNNNNNNKNNNNRNVFFMIND